MGKCFVYPNRKSSPLQAVGMMPEAISEGLKRGSNEAWPTEILNLLWDFLYPKDRVWITHGFEGEVDPNPFRTQPTKQRKLNSDIAQVMMQIDPEMPIPAIVLKQATSKQEAWKAGKQGKRMNHNQHHHRTLRNYLLDYSRATKTDIETMYHREHQVREIRRMVPSSSNNTPLDWDPNNRSEPPEHKAERDPKVGGRHDHGGQRDLQTNWTVRNFAKGQKWNQYISPRDRGLHAGKETYPEPDILYIENQGQNQKPEFSIHDKQAYRTENRTGRNQGRYKSMDRGTNRHPDQTEKNKQIPKYTHLNPRAPMVRRMAALLEYLRQDKERTYGPSIVRHWIRPATSTTEVHPRFLSIDRSYPLGSLVLFSNWDHLTAPKGLAERIVERLRGGTQSIQDKFQNGDNVGRWWLGLPPNRYQDFWEQMTTKPPEDRNVTRDVHICTMVADAPTWHIGRIFWIMKRWLNEWKIPKYRRLTQQKRRENAQTRANTIGAVPEHPPAYLPSLTKVKTLSPGSPWDFRIVTGKNTFRRELQTLAQDVIRTEDRSNGRNGRSFVAMDFWPSMEGKGHSRQNPRNPERTGTGTRLRCAA